MLRASCGGASTLLLAAPNVRAALDSIEASHPELYRSVCNETGAVRQHVAVFVNAQMIASRADLDISLQSEDKVMVIQALTGG